MDRARGDSARVYIDGALANIDVISDNLKGSIDTAAPLVLAGPEQPFRGLIDEVRIYDRSLSTAEVVEVAGSQVWGELLARPAGGRTEAEDRLLRDYYLRTHVDGYAALATQIAATDRQLEELLSEVPTVMVMAESSTPRPTFVLADGRYDQPGAAVSAGVPSFLAPKIEESRTLNRLDLARWITSPDNPLTARVVVNRYWQHFFGRGIVSTPDDFGVEGAAPSHPELLDWLAAEFVASGWDTKRLHYLIVTSATYRQSSQYHSEADPENRWLARMPRLRLPAESIRDSALAISGMLVERLGGPGVFPGQPPGLWREVSYDPDEFTAQVYRPSRGADRFRRSLYTFWKRSVPPPNMEVFDAPTRETCVARRERTNTPLQALVLMNDPLFHRAAQALAERVRQYPGDDREKLQFLYEATLGAAPTSRQIDVLARLLELPVETRWMAISSVLMQTNAFVTRP